MTGVQTCALPIYGANLRPPLKLHVQFSRMQLSRRRARADRKARNKLDQVPQPPTLSTKEWPFLAAVGLSQSASLLNRECTGLSLRELFLLLDLALLAFFPFLTV